MAMEHACVSSVKSNHTIRVDEPDVSTKHADTEEQMLRCIMHASPQYDLLRMRSAPAQAAWFHHDVPDSEAEYNETQ